MGLAFAAAACTEMNDREPAANFRPFVPPEARLREFSLRAVLLGTLLGMLFGASSLYLVLKVGLTVSASIPVAVISLTLFRVWSRLGGRAATVLENNIVQTAGSAGESIAFGVGVTMPAILILGFELGALHVVLVSLLGGLLGVLMMVPLRRALIVRKHGELRYPEGTACAEVLKAAADAESLAAAGAVSRSTGRRALGAHLVFSGLGVGFAYKLLMSGLRLWKETPEKVFGGQLSGGSISAEISPELVGVGYIIGPRISSVLLAGGVLSYLVLIPLIKFFGQHAGTVIAPGIATVGEMSPHQIRDAYILYIGAGAVAAGGIISMLRSLPLIWSSLKSTVTGLSEIFSAVPGRSSRTEEELPLGAVLTGLILLIVAILCAPPLRMNLLGAVLIVVFGFMFVTVSSRLTGEIGSSSNPISGMTVATLLLACLAFVMVGWTGQQYFVTALSVGAVVCIASANAGTTSQDLKTGFLLGATPRLQQYAILIGTIASALILGPVLVLLNSASTVYVPAERVAPELHVNIGAITESREEKLPASQFPEDQRTYRVWYKTDPEGGPPGKYLIDDSGRVVWFVDPGINGRFAERPDGSQVVKFYAPKAMLMSYIIKGILGGQLPWTLVIAGVMIAVVLELCGVSSLAFAVGVYLPISASVPIFVGGMIRLVADRRKHMGAAPGAARGSNPSEEGDEPGVLFASGYIAGGTLAGIIIALVLGVFGAPFAGLDAWARSSNPFYAGRHADALSLIPFVLLCAGLWLAGTTKNRPRE